MKPMKPMKEWDATDAVEQLEAIRSAAKERGAQGMADAMDTIAEIVASMKARANDDSPRQQADQVILDALGIAKPIRTTADVAGWLNTLEDRMRRAGFREVAVQLIGLGSLLEANAVCLAELSADDNFEDDDPKEPGRRLDMLLQAKKDLDDVFERLHGLGRDFQSVFGVDVDLDDQAKQQELLLTLKPFVAAWQQADHWDCDLDAYAQNMAKIARDEDSVDAFDVFLEAFKADEDATDPVEFMNGLINGTSAPEPEPTSEPVKLPEAIEALLREQAEGESAEDFAARVRSALATRDNVEAWTTGDLKRVLLA